MNADEVVRYWRASSEEDWLVAEHQFEGRDHRYALFLAHLSLEKLLTAVVVRATAEHAPRTHNLLRLAERGGLDVTEARRDVLLRATGYNLEARYPDDLSAARDRFDEAFTRSELDAMKEVGQWLKSALDRRPPPSTL
jgi:HEPN domain-containing protein